MKEKPSVSQLSGVKEIARRANVSIATVDRVIHNRKGVSEATKEKINGIIKEIGFQPNILASRLASKKTNRFAFLIPNANETDYWDASLKGIERAHQEIKQYGIQLDKYLFDLNDKATFTKNVNEIAKGDYDGIVMAPSFIEEATELAARCQSRKIPYVFINSDIPGKNNIAYIGPHLYQSGCQAGQLVRFGLKRGKVLIINISREIDSYHHLLRKEDGFRHYIEDSNTAANHIAIEKMDITNTTDESVSVALDTFLKNHTDIDAFFVTNSRVRSVATYLRTHASPHRILIGYDLSGENIKYLKDGTIDFLIGQKPEEQGYAGLMALFQHVVAGSTVIKNQYMPIDIITKENFEFYKN
ncbi:LacI family DNA-binding transcriptional regulator [Parapedobacter koreensis]|uniref:Transcriptional regulator, LacI family n=1 Tax=Parapedobacter koreensis TaxID=332977 RepID=A0A1H7S6I6_9SPHI|nr:substrate-binding domain-containing protein [Parapedobacter koreensis]SEL67344.1 transcriptional regulator, LacI family [Parapedobacter koreensis]